MQPNNGGFIYRYVVGNGPKAAEPIWCWQIVDPAEDAGAEPDESVWQGFRAAGDGLRPAKEQVFPGAAPGVVVLWRSLENPIAPGRSRGAFRLESNFLPGLTTSAFTSGTYFAFPDEPPAELDDVIASLSRAEIAQQIRLTIGPRYAPAASPDKWAGLLARDLRAAYDVMPAFRRSAYVQKVLQSLDKCAVSPVCVLRGDVAERPATPLEQDIRRAVEAASTWFSRRE